MLNKRFLFLISVLSLSFLGNVDNANPMEAYFSTSFSCIGPFERGCSDYVLSGQVTARKAVVALIERMTVKTIDGTVVKTQKSKYHSVDKGDKYTLTFTLPFQSSLTEKGLNVVIDFLNDNNSLLHSFTFNIKPIRRTTINPKLYINDYYVIDDIVVDPDNYTKVKDEKIRFDQALDYFNSDTYYRLSLDDVLISYECGLPFPGCIAHLHFVDYLKSFPYLDSENEVPTFDIPLRTIIKNKAISFAFPQVMYVKPSTLEMSLEARPGFTSTSYFYLPKNRCEDILDQVFNVVVSEFGHGKTSFTWDMRYLNNQRLIGDCSNSDYCVIGEDANG